MTSLSNRCLFVVSPLLLPVLGLLVLPLGGVWSTVTVVDSTFGSTAGLVDGGAAAAALAKTLAKVGTTTDSVAAAATGAGPAEVASDVAAGAAGAVSGATATAAAGLGSAARLAGTSGLGCVVVVLLVGDAEAGDSLVGAAVDDITGEDNSEAAAGAVATVVKADS